MRISRSLTRLAACLAVGLCLAACSSPGGTSSPGTSPAPGEGGTSQTKELPPGDFKITIKVGGNETLFSPNAVYCKGSPAAIHHVIAKGANGLPLVEVTPGKFAMVKVAQAGPPEKANNPAGIAVKGETVIFNDSRIGNATVSGSLKCTKFEG